jgi:hypothetical protein
VSTSSSKVYFLDGDSKLRSLSPTAVVEDVRGLPGDALRRVTFSVDPDDKRIAIAQIDYSQNPPALQLYVEDLLDGGHVSVFASSAVYFWPVGWHESRILLASGPARVRGYVPLNPYSASRYFSIDPVAGSQPQAVGSGDCAPTGVITAAGTACVADPGLPCKGKFALTYDNFDWYTSCLWKLDWTGAKTNFLIAKQYLGNLVVKQAAISSDGSVILTDGYLLIKVPVDGRPGWQNQYGMPPPAAPDQPGMGWIDPFHVSMIYVQPDGTRFQRILQFTIDRETIGPVAFEGYSMQFGVASSPITAQFVGSLPGGI